MTDKTPGAADFSQLSGEMYRAWEQSMTRWWDSVLDSPQFMGAVGRNLEAGARARGQYESAVDDALTKMHLPTRKDLVQVARICSLLEDRLLGMEDRLLTIGDRLASMEKEVVLARIEAAEARVEQREGLAALRARLEALEAPAPKRAPRRRSKAGEAS